MKGLCSLPGVLSRHDMECMTSEQVENIPMVVILLSDSNESGLQGKEQKLITCVTNT